MGLRYSPIDHGREEKKSIPMELGLVSFEQGASNTLALHAVKGGTVRRNLWLADSSASSHMTNDESGLFNVKLIESKITIGDGKYLRAEKIGSLKLAYIINKATTTITLKNVKYAS